MEQNNLFRFSVENALEIIMGIDADGMIVYANRTAKEQLEYGEELVGCPFSEIYPEIVRMRNGRLELVDTESANLKSVMAYRRNRTCFPTKVKLFGPDVAGCGLAYICMSYDITLENFWEKRAGVAEQEAYEAAKVKTEFVANVTHELRTPVNGILGNTQELINRETETDKMKLLQLVERGCRDMNALINNILDFSKLEAGKFTLENREFHFRNMIEYVKSNHSSRMNEKGLDFSFSISPEIPEHIIGDELRLVQVLNNLISNAGKFTSVGEIHVEIVKTAWSGNQIELFFMVIDSGIGISRADQGKLFKSFVQADASISRKYGGTGLGLNICKQLVELMGGSIHVESELGKGTIFSFNIWVEVPSTEDVLYGAQQVTDNREILLLNKIQDLSENRSGEKIWTYGERENLEEINKKMSKLILSVEMDNWEKAEGFAETVKELVSEAPQEIRSAALRLKMAVQKGDYDKSAAAYGVLKKCLEQNGD